MQALWPDYPVFQAVAGWLSSICLAKDAQSPTGGQPFTWGATFGLAQGCPTPVKVTEFSGYGKSRAVKVASGSACFMLIDKNGALFSWGSGLSGQLGHGNTQSLTSPKKVAGFGSITVMEIALGYFSAMAITKGGMLWSWGLDNDSGVGCLGHGPGFSEVWEPLQIASLVDVQIEEVKMGQNKHMCFAMARDQEGVLYSWGGGVEHPTLLGHGSAVDRIEFPTQLKLHHHRA